MITRIESLQNPSVKEVVRLRKRSHRDDEALLLVEGYREVLRALDNRIPLTKLFFCKDLFLGKNEPLLVRRAEESGTAIYDCSPAVFEKIAYRDRPEGLLAISPRRRTGLEDLRLPENPLLLVAEHIEKPGNLGTMLRSADAAGADAIILCDKCTDVLNPNVVRASIGTIFTVPLAEATTEETIAFLRKRGIATLAASPHARKDFTEADMTRGVALVVGAEQYGLSETWMTEADEPVVIPMLGQADSLNVAAAATILLYEAVRQRRLAAKQKA